MNASEFSDIIAYALSSWLRADPSAALSKIDEITMAASFLFTTKVLKKEFRSEDELARLPSTRDTAVSIQLKTSGLSLLEGGTPFRDYFGWIRDAVPETRFAGQDYESLLALAVADELVTDIIAAMGEKTSPTFLSEIIYLYVVDFFRQSMLEECPDHYRALRSFPFFESVAEEFQLIRGEIPD